MKVALRSTDSRRSDNSRHGEVRLPPVVAVALATPGEPLAADVRAEMEARLGHDFADVRIHVDARAAAAARALDAVAFTSGSEIVFAPGRYSPHDHEGRWLLAHELVHTLQQRGTRADGVQVSAPVAAAADPLEAEAAAVAARVAAGETMPPGAVSVGAPAARGVIARQAREAIARAPLEVPDSPDANRAVADDVARLMAFDPDDVFGRVRRRLARLAPATREVVVNAVRSRVPAPAAARLGAILVELRPPGAGPPPGAEPVDRETIAARTPEAAPALTALREPAAVVDRPPEPDPERAAEVREDSAPPERAAPAEPESTTRAAAAEAEHPPEQLAAEAVAGLSAPEPADAPEAAPEMERAEAAPAETAEAAAPSGGDAESSEPADAVDPRVEQAGAAEQEDSEDEAAAAEAAAPAPSTAPPEAQAGEPVAPQGPVAEPPPAPAPAADEPEIAPADADSGAGAPLAGEAQEVAAETGVDDTEAAGGESEPGPAGGEDQGAAEPGGSEQLAAEPESPEQPGTEPAADPAAGAVELGPLAEVEPGEDDADAGGDPGGGAAPIGDPPAPHIPDVGGGEPEAAIETVTALPPTAAAAALDGVKGAAIRTVAGQRSDLAASPPQLERPTGAPSAAEAAAEAPAAAVAGGGAARVERVPAGASFPAPAPRPLPPAPAPPTAAVRTPQLGGSGDHVTESDLAAIRGAVKALPTTDPALAVTAGAPPPLELKGDADPARTGEQRAELDKATVATRTQGAADAGAPMGEAAVLPKVASETLRAAIVSASAPAAAAPTAVGPSVPDPAIDAVVRERQPGELQAAAATARGEMNAERQKQAKATESAGAESRANIEKEIADNAAAQRRERDDVRAGAHEQRQQWNTAQKDLVDATQQDADKTAVKSATDVATEREKGTVAADTHIATGNAAVATARENAEREATEAQRKGEDEPTGFLGWVASEAKAFFDSIKTAITKAFEAARAAVKQAIESAQKLAGEAIDTARKAIVELVKEAGDRLIEIGDRVLGGFPKLRDKFRGAIRATVAAAQRAVDALADALKAGVKAYLDLYAAVLDGVLGLLQVGLLAVVDGYAAVVQGAIKAAQVVVNGLGDLLQVARDVASGPRAWVRNLGAAIVDGVRNHLWTALKLAVSGWFNAKVDAILGIGKLIWNVLAKGGITVAAVAKMAFAALKKVIPIALIKLLITKLVGMLVPAAAAVMAIIEGLQAAWGAAGHILGALSKFIVFLKAVKGGNAGPQFAAAVAAAAVAVLEFVSFWLLRKLLKPAAAVGKAIKGIAAKIAAKLRRLIQALKRGVKKLTRRVKAWMLKTGRRFKKLRDRIFGKKSKKDKRRRQQERLDRAVAAIKPPLEAMLRKGTSPTVLRLRLGWWRLRWWLSSLSVQPGGRIVARINPEGELTRKQKVQMGADLERILALAEDAYFRRHMAELEQARAEGETDPLQEAERRLMRGETRMPAMSRADQTLLMRRIQQGEVVPWGMTPVPKPYRLTPTPVAGEKPKRSTGGRAAVSFEGEGGRMSLATQSSMATGKVPIPGGGRGFYVDLVRGVSNFSKDTGVGEAALMDVIRAPSAAAQTERLSALASSLGEPQRSTLLNRFGPMAREVGFLTQALEPARAPGMFAAAGLAHHASASPEALLGGTLTPLGPKGAAGTAAAERRLGWARGEPLPSSATPAKPLTAKQRSLVRTRRDRVARIFLTLRAAVRSGEIEALAGAQAEAMRRISQAFEKWADRRLKSQAPAALERAEQALQVELVAWMRSFYG